MSMQILVTLQSTVRPIATVMTVMTYLERSTKAEVHELHLRIVRHRLETDVLELNIAVLWAGVRHAVQRKRKEVNIGPRGIVSRAKNHTNDEIASSQIHVERFSGGVRQAKQEKGQANKLGGKAFTREMVI